MRKLWWTRNGSGVVSLWFIGWLVLIPVALSLAGLHSLADGVREWQILILPVSATAAHWIYHQDEGPQAVALGILVAASWWLLKQFPSDPDIDCGEEGCGISEAQMGALAIIVSAVVLTYYRPTQDKLKQSVNNVRGYLLTKGSPKENIDKLLDGTLRYDHMLFPDGIEKPWEPPQWMKDHLAADKPKDPRASETYEPGGAGTAFADTDGDGAPG